MKGVCFALVVLIGCVLEMLDVQAAELKIGFVNAAEILDKAPQAEAARSRLEKEFAPRDQELIGQRRLLRNKEEDLAKNNSTMSDAERRVLEREIRSLRRDLERSQEDFREDFNIRRNEELNKLQRQVYEAIVDLAKEEQFDLIVNDGAVIYASKQVDLTNKVLERLAQ